MACLYYIVMTLSLSCSTADPAQGCSAKQWTGRTPSGLQPRIFGKAWGRTGQRGGLGLGQLFLLGWLQLQWMWGPGSLWLLSLSQAVGPAGLLLSLHMEWALLTTPELKIGKKFFPKGIWRYYLQKKGKGYWGDISMHSCIAIPQGEGSHVSLEGQGELISWTPRLSCYCWLKYLFWIGDKILKVQISPWICFRIF